MKLTSVPVPIRDFLITKRLVIIELTVFASVEDFVAFLTFESINLIFFYRFMKALGRKN